MHRKSRGRTVPVNQYDLDGQYIQSYSSIKAARVATGAASIQRIESEILCIKISVAINGGLIQGTTK